MILFNGRIFTSNAGQPYVEALAIRGERIFAVGTSKEIVTIAGKEARRIDLRGHTVIPGINDAHRHLAVGPKTYELPIKNMDPQWKEIIESLASAVATVPKETWISTTFGPTALAVLSQDIFHIPLNDLPKTDSVLTLVGGKVVYDAKVLGTR